MTLWEVRQAIESVIPWWGPLLMIFIGASLLYVVARIEKANLFRRFVCWLNRQHTDPRLLKVDLGIHENAEHWSCRYCSSFWTEYSSTGCH